MSDDRTFFDETRGQSVVKTKIVEKYFRAWAKVIGSATKRRESRIAYVDVFAGPGRYADGAKSTPLLILEQAIADPDMRLRLVTLFNDGDPENAKSLTREIAALPGIERLRYRPQVSERMVDEELAAWFEQRKLVPTLFFIDPWGYKGLSLRLIGSVLKDWGCECIFFFNYNRISMGLPNEVVTQHLDALFGAERAALRRRQRRDASVKARVRSPRTFVCRSRTAETIVGSSSSIEWTGATWNPVTGCDKVSPGCKHCYAERMAERLRAMGQPNYAQGFAVTPHEHMLLRPLSWKKPQTIFVNSMSDLFHEAVDPEFILRVFDIMSRAHWHQFQVLTKRAFRVRELDRLLAWEANIWMGVSVEHEDYLERVDHLRATRAALKFLSLEPLLGRLPSLDLRGIDWVVVGGESGPGARPMNRSWVLEIRDQCQRARVPFFFKQWGGVIKKRAGRELAGRTWDEMPEVSTP